jgi:hypothetical protein
LQLDADEFHSEGLTSAEAQEQARRALGNRALAEERFYESSRWMFGQHLARDLRFATRVLRKEPKFSVLAILGLALGIGVSTAFMAFVNLSSAPHGAGIRPPEEVLDLTSYVGIDRGLNALGSAFSFPEYRYLVHHAIAVGVRRPSYKLGMDSISGTQRERGFRPAGRAMCCAWPSICARSKASSRIVMRRWTAPRFPDGPREFVQRLDVPASGTPFLGPSLGLRYAVARDSNDPATAASSALADPTSFTALTAIFSNRTEFPVGQSRLSTLGLIIRWSYWESLIDHMAGQASSLGESDLPARAYFEIFTFGRDS